MSHGAVALAAAGGRNWGSARSLALSLTLTLSQPHHLSVGGGSSLLEFSLFFKKVNGPLPKGV